MEQKPKTRRVRCCIYCGKEKDGLTPWLRVQTTSRPKVYIDICPECHEWNRQRLRTKEYKGQLVVVEGAL